MPNIRSRDLEAIYRSHDAIEASIRVQTHLIERINDLEASHTAMASLLDKVVDIAGTVLKNNEQLSKDFAELKEKKP